MRFSLFPLSQYNRDIQLLVAAQDGQRNRIAGGFMQDEITDHIVEGNDRLTVNGNDQVAAFVQVLVARQVEGPIASLNTSQV